MKQESSIVGIDLGTTLSALAVIDEHGKPYVVPNAEGSNLTSSAVFFGDEGIVVGQDALFLGVSQPDCLVRFIKRQMGRPGWYYPYHGRDYAPEDVSTEILKKLKDDAEMALGLPVTDAVITVPAYFDDAKRRATIVAGERAGLNVVRLINEPTAAALAFGLDRRPEAQTVLVYDLGGGTFDVTVMRLEGKRIRVLATAGEHELGGKDFDDRILGYVVEAFQAQHGFDPTEDREIEAELREHAVRAKHMLSRQGQAVVNVRAQGLSLRVPLTRGEFESLIRAKLDITMMLVEDVLKEATLSKGDVDVVLLVGGSTRIPAVRRLLETHFGQPPEASINPDEAVALGAALAGALEMLEEENLRKQLAPEVVERLDGVEFQDVVSHSLGVRVYDSRVGGPRNSILIPRNTPIPHSCHRRYGTRHDGQTSLYIVVLQGEHEDPDLCNPIGEFVVADLPANRPAGTPVEVVFTCNELGVLEVEAIDVETGKRGHTTVRYAGGPAPRSLEERWRAATE